MLAVDKPRMVEADGLLTGDPDDLLAEGVERRALISLYRLARCRPPESQQKKREWVREQLLRLTAAKQRNKRSPPTSARDQGLPLSARDPPTLTGHPPAGSASDTEANSLSVQHSSTIPSTTPSLTAAVANPAFPLHPGEGTEASAVSAGHMVTANGYVSGRPPLPLTNHRVNSQPGYFQPRSLPNTTLDTVRTSYETEME